MELYRIKIKGKEYPYYVVNVGKQYYGEINKIIDALVKGKTIEKIEKAEEWWVTDTILSEKEIANILAYYINVVDYMYYNEKYQILEFINKSYMPIEIINTKLATIIIKNQLKRIFGYDFNRDEYVNNYIKDYVTDEIINEIRSAYIELKYIKEAYGTAKCESFHKKLLELSKVVNDALDKLYEKNKMEHLYEQCLVKEQMPAKDEKLMEWGKWDRNYYYIVWKDKERWNRILVHKLIWRRFLIKEGIEYIVKRRILKALDRWALERYMEAIMHYTDRYKREIVGKTLMDVGLLYRIEMVKRI